MKVFFINNLQKIKAGLLVKSFRGYKLLKKQYCSSAQQMNLFFINGLQKIEADILLKSFRGYKLLKKQ